MKFFSLLAAGTVLAVGHVGAAEPGESKNPFSAAVAPQAVAPAEPNSLELRGIVSGNNGTALFGIFDPVKRQSVWVRLDDTSPEQNFVVKSHDPARGTVRVEYGGRTIELQLKEASIQAMAAPAPMPMPMPNPQPQMGAPRPGAPAGPQPTQVVTANSAEEAKRLEGVAQEVRRRRMMRQQAGQAPQPAPQPQR